MSDQLTLRGVVIVVSAHEDEDAHRRAFEQGAVDVLYKPFRETDLLNAIQKVLAGEP